jgi:hypothetical protein
MNSNKREEQIAVYRTMKAIGLKRRLPEEPGSFNYVRGADKMSFIWDGAGLDKGNKLYLLEAELSESHGSLHIQGHLSRAVGMRIIGEPVHKLIWITYASSYQNLKKIVDGWLSMYYPILPTYIPDMEYRAPNGDLLDQSKICKTGAGV